MVREVCPEQIGLGKTDPFCPEEMKNGMVLSKVPFRQYIDQYVLSFYWALWMVMGNGQGNQINTRTYAFAACMLVVGMAAFSIIIGSMSALLTNMDAEKLERQKELDFVNRYLQVRKVNPELQRQITDYYEYIWDTGNTPYHKKLFHQLPKQLKQKLGVQLRRSLIEKVPMFSECQNETVLELLERLQPVAAVQHEFVIHVGDIATCMYFVEHGRLSCMIKTLQQTWVEVA